MRASRPAFSAHLLCSRVMVLVWCSEMERLRKEREAKELAARSKARAAKEERRMQQLSEEERLKEERRACDGGGPGERGIPCAFGRSAGSVGDTGNDSHSGRLISRNLGV